MPPTFKLDYSDPTKTVSLRTTVSLDTESPYVTSFVGALNALSVVAPMDRIDCDDPGPPGGGFRCTLRTKNGRKWEQTVLYEPPAPVKLKFSVNEYWTVAEVAMQGKVRDACIALIMQCGLVDFSVKWT